MRLTLAVSLLDLRAISKEAAAIEIKACGKVLKDITGQAPHLFRPPGGDYNRRVAEVAEALGYTTVFWTVNSRDCTKPGKTAIRNRLLKRVTNGGILLLHDGIQQTVDMLPDLLEALREKGYELVTIEGMMSHRGKGEHETTGLGSNRF